jgi:hypothetical protein
LITSPKREASREGDGSIFDDSGAGKLAQRVCFSKNESKNAWDQPMNGERRDTSFGSFLASTTST